MQMQQLNLVEPGKLEWREAPMPVLDSDHSAIVRPLTVSTCDIDGLMIRGEARSRRNMPLGHEGEGIIVEIGDKVEKFSLGDRVIIPWKIACGSCISCERGHTAQCIPAPPVNCYGFITDRGGFLADGVLVPWADSTLTPMPAGTDPVQICGVADNISDGWRAVAPYLKERPGGTVLICGFKSPGSIGLYAAGIAVSLGAARVVYADHDLDRLQIAEALGAEAYDLKAQDLATLKSDLKSFTGGFDITVDGGGNGQWLTDLFHLTAPAGVCVSTAGLLYENQEVILPVYELYQKSASFHTGFVHTHSLIEEPLKLVASGQFDPSPVTTQVVKWEEAGEALLEPFTKIIITRSA